MFSAALMSLFATLTGNIMIYVGIAFVNEQLFPQALSDFYTRSGMLSRVLIMSVITAPIVNYLFSIAYQKVGAGHAGMMIISTLALVLIAKAVLLHGSGLNMRIVMASGVLICAASWVAYELHRAA